MLMMAHPITYTNQQQYLVIVQCLLADVRQPPESLNFSTVHFFHVFILSY